MSKLSDFIGGASDEECPVGGVITLPSNYPIDFTSNGSRYIGSGFYEDDLSTVDVEKSLVINDSFVDLGLTQTGAVGTLSAILEVSDGYVFAVDKYIFKTDKAFQTCRKVYTITGRVIYYLERLSNGHIHGVSSNVDNDRHTGSAVLLYSTDEGETWAKSSSVASNTADRTETVFYNRYIHSTDTNTKLGKANRACFFQGKWYINTCHIFGYQRYSYTTSAFTRYESHKGVSIQTSVGTYKFSTTHFAGHSEYVAARDDDSMALIVGKQSAISTKTGHNLPQLHRLESDGDGGLTSTNLTIPYRAAVGETVITHYNLHSYNGFFFLFTDKGLFRTTDGTSFELCDIQGIREAGLNSPQVYDLHVKDDGLLYGTVDVGGGHVLVRTSNPTGLTWELPDSAYSIIGSLSLLGMQGRYWVLSDIYPIVGAVDGKLQALQATTASGKVGIPLISAAGNRTFYLRVK